MMGLGLLVPILVIVALAYAWSWLPPNQERNLRHQKKKRTGSTAVLATLYIRSKTGENSSRFDDSNTRKLAGMHVML